MLKFGNKEFRNLQEQVEENMKDIEKLKTGQAVLDEFGIKVVGEVESVDDMPTVSEYKEATPDWEYGDAYAVGSTSPYTLYILTRANGTHEEDYWFNIGVFPMPGPQGEQGPQGPEGQQGQTGDTGPAGSSAGFGTPTATASMTTRGSAPVVNVTASGPDTEKVFNFDFYLPVATPKVTITSVSGTLTLAEYNILFNFEDSVVVFKPSGSLAHNAYTLQRWYSSDDYIVFICLYNYTPYKTGVYRCRVDRSNRSYLIYADEAIKINKWNISTAINSTTNETAGYVLTADGNGGASWSDPENFGSVSFTITTTTGTLSDANYLKAAGDNCTIIYDDNSTKVSFRKYDETSTTITYAGPFTEGSMTYWYGLGINKAGKTWVMASSAMPISASNIKSGSSVSGLVLTTNGSGGSSWESLPSPPVLAWGNISGTLSNQTDLKNALDDKQDELTEPDTPTGTIYEYLGFTSAGVVSKNTMVPVSKISDIADVAITGSYTDLLNQPSIPDPQVQSNWTQTNSSKIDYIKNKPTLATVATSGSYNDLINKPTIPAAQVQSDYTQSDTSAVDYIKNKPDLSIYAQSSSLATVATSGSYDDLLDKPTLFSGSYNDLTDKPDLSIYAETSDLATVATTGDYDDLLNKPTIPTVDYPVTDVQVNGSSVVTNKVAEITVPDVSHMVTDNTNQMITGSKTFVPGITLQTNTTDNIAAAIARYSEGLRITANELGSISFETVNSNGNYTGKVKFDLDNTSGNNNVSPSYNANTINYDLGTSSNKWNDLYLKGSLKDGTNSLSIADINTAIGSIPTKVSDLDNDSGYTTNTGTVTSVGVSGDNHISISGSPITSSGTITVGVASGYSIPSTTDQTNWSSKVKYCGTLGGTGATLTWNEAALHYFNVGDMYKVTSTSFIYTQYKIGNYMICTTAGLGSAADFAIINSLDSYTEGTVTSVGITRTSGSHLTASGTVTSSGNLSIGVESGYSIPSDTDQSAWTAKYDKPSGGIPGTDLADSYYLASNPDGFTSNVGTVTSVNNTSPDGNGNVTISIPTVPTNVSDFTNDAGYITGINSSDVTTALGYTPLNSTACTYQTTAPTAAISDGGVHIVYLSAEPSTKYSGYIYMIAEA